LIRLDLLSILEHRDVALRAVSTACRQVAKPATPEDWARLGDFRIQVVSALGEAFNNIVLHGYAGRRDGLIKLRIEPRPGELKVEVRDWGKSFDPGSVPAPDLEGLPESGLGLYIIHSFMEVSYSAGRPNILSLYKKLQHKSDDKSDDKSDRKASEGAGRAGDPEGGS
jgi:anti-sigma regulatory factor (Ser/Thr protein kinase)